MTETSTPSETLMDLTTDIVVSYVKHNALRLEALPELIQQVYSSIKNLDAEPAPAAVIALPVPAVSVRKSVTPDALICLDCGKAFKAIKRHLRTTHGMTPDEYRVKWALPNDYPIVSPNYSATRSDMAKSFGLGKARAVAEEKPKRSKRTSPAKG